MSGEIHRPLGQNRKKSKTRSAQGRSWVYVACTFACLAGAAIFLSLGSDDAFRTPQSQKGSSPEIASAQAPQAATPAPNAAIPADAVAPPVPTGPKIITVQAPSRIAQDRRTAHLPDPDLVEKSSHGLLPVRAADGKRPLDAYARGWSGARGARIAIVIGGLGLSQTGTQNAIRALPEEVTLAFAPHGNSLQRWMQNARQSGHEILMQVPLEPFDYPRINPGRNTLTVGATASENIDRLHWAMGRTTNYAGIMNYMGARFTADRPAMTPVMTEIGKRGLFYLDDGTSARSSADSIAAAQGTPFAAADLVIDAQQERGAILQKLDELERTARAKGTAIGIGSAFDTTVYAVSAWVNEVKARGVEIVPVSALVRDPERE